MADRSYCCATPLGIHFYSCKIADDDSFLESSLYTEVLHHVSLQRNGLDVSVYILTQRNREKEINPHKCFYINLLHVIVFPFFPQSNFRNSIFSLSEFNLFPWSERKGWSQLRFANVFLITASEGEKMHANTFYYFALNFQLQRAKEKEFSLMYLQIKNDCGIRATSSYALSNVVQQVTVSKLHKLFP